MITRQRISLTLKDQTVLYGWSWKNDEPCIANVIIVTGMEETGIRYEDFAKFLCQNHLNVYCIDHFGQGENVLPDLSNLGIWPRSGFRKMVVAIDDLVGELKLSCRPIYVFAHSMGSFMMQDYVQRFAGRVDKVVLCGTGKKNPLAGLGFLIAKLVVNKKNVYKKAKLLNKLMFGSFNKGIENATSSSWISHSKENIAKYDQDPLCGFGPNNGFCYEFLKGLSRIWKRKFLKKISPNLPMFLIAGDGDPVTSYGKSPEAMKKLYAKYGNKNVDTKVYKHARHEILNEDFPTAQEAYNDILNFFLKA